MIVRIHDEEGMAYEISEDLGVTCDVPDHVVSSWKEAKRLFDAMQEEMAMYYHKSPRETVIMDSSTKPPPRIDLAREIQSTILTEQIMGKDAQ